MAMRAKSGGQVAGAGPALDGGPGGLGGPPMITTSKPRA
jgi:hypothetical protein